MFCNVNRHTHQSVVSAFLPPLSPDSVASPLTTPLQSYRKISGPFIVRLNVPNWQRQNDCCALGKEGGGQLQIHLNFGRAPVKERCDGLIAFVTTDRTSSEALSAPLF